MFSVAGMSRSVTVTTAYIMTVTKLGWREALNAVRGGRRCANPNYGFQRQLLAFYHDRLPAVSFRSAVWLATILYAKRCTRTHNTAESIM